MVPIATQFNNKLTSEKDEINGSSNCLGWPQIEILEVKKIFDLAYQKKEPASMFMEEL